MAAADRSCGQDARRKSLKNRTGAGQGFSFSPHHHIERPLPGILRRAPERRIERLRASVLSLGEGRPELARSLDPVLASLEEVSSAIEVAEAMPLAKRMRAHQKVDRILDGLEAGLFDAALPQLPHGL